MCSNADHAAGGPKPAIQDKASEKSKGDPPTAKKRHKDHLASKPQHRPEHFKLNLAVNPAAG
jgi:hypothetical protein